MFIGLSYALLVTLVVSLARPSLKRGSGDTAISELCSVAEMSWRDKQLSIHNITPTTPLALYICVTLSYVNFVVIVPQILGNVAQLG